ncbi:MAG: hypothetical protein C4524_03750 [Candidatus Zixiibacteriota bacterium]|nr:MAG: hypothetical protein C4524_03750 [candidate division Zixibacteria bacterium]
MIFRVILAALLLGASGAAIVPAWAQPDTGQELPAVPADSALTVAPDSLPDTVGVENTGEKKGILWQVIIPVAVVAAAGGLLLLLFTQRG